MFKAIVIEKDASAYQARLTELNDEQLPEGDVTVRVSYSTLNFKDGLAITGKGPVVRQFPMVPGIDLAGTVETSTHPRYQPGDKVLLNGWGVGETHWGGLAQKARVKGDWLIPLPLGMTERQAMAIGTAGYTSMLCLMALERHGVRPDQAGFWSRAQRWGGEFRDRASGTQRLFGHRRDRQARGGRLPRETGRGNDHPPVRALGARAPLGKERWAAAIDSVAAIPWPMSAPAPGRKGRSPRVAWLRAWTCRQPWRPSSCGA